MVRDVVERQGSDGSKGPVYAPIERRKVYELVAENLLREIAGRRLKPGDAVPTERELTNAYQVGRSSVREALRTLESLGLIRPAGHGAFVVADYGQLLRTPVQLLLSLEEGDLDQLYELRKILEVEIAALAAERRTASDLETLERWLHRMEEGLGSREDYVTADLGFHLAVGEASRNRIAVHVMKAIREVLHQALLEVYQIPGSPTRSLTQHRQILAAIGRGDPVAARELMRRHLTRVQGEIRQVVEHGLPAEEERRRPRGSDRGPGPRPMRWRG
ncbi:MAG TPA: FadR/GntR family transcriptional regulator [Candidatus Dormibacteraeota bacterium]|nr:FadR/GntR family transcriptional regulator [Candidatus Dormibacteraeota bacterium]